MPKKVKKKTKFGRPSKSTMPHDNHNNVGESTSSRTIKVEYLQSPNKPLMDNTEYRTIRLPNGFTALLASRRADVSRKKEVRDCGCEVSKGTKQDAVDSSDVLANRKKEVSSTVRCSLAIDVGHFSDPLLVPGISRLLTLLVPRLSKKYPLPRNNFEDKVSYSRKHSAAEKTVIDFHTCKDSLNDTLDRFAQCYIAPVIRRSDFIRELENINGRKDCPVRKKNMSCAHALASLGSDRHPMRCFGEHYYDKLGEVNADTIYRELVEFREQHYSAHRMNFFIGAELSIENLEEIVKKHFSAIPSNGISPRDFSHHNFSNSFQTPKLITIHGTHTSAIELTWSLPPSQWLYRCNPYTYISWILQHFGEGSLRTHLINKKWCNKISCGVKTPGSEIDRVTNDFYDNSIYTLLSVAVYLTDEGRKNLNHVIEDVYSYIATMRREGPQEMIWEEIRKIRDNEFRSCSYDNWSEKELGSVTSGMHLYPPLDYLSAVRTLHEYDPDFIETCTNLMTPDRAFVVIHEKTDRTDSTIVKPFSVEGSAVKTAFYTIEKICDASIETWKNAKPLANFKIPNIKGLSFQKFNVVPTTEDTSVYPEKIFSNVSSEIWHKCDENDTDTCFMFFSFTNPLPLRSSENAAMLDVFVNALNFLMGIVLSMNQYPGFSGCLIRADEKGLHITVDGRRQEILAIIQLITVQMKDCWVEMLTKLSVEFAADIQYASYESILKIRDERIDDVKAFIQRQFHWTICDKRKVLLNCDSKKFLKFYEQFVKQTYVKCYIHGNISKTEVMIIVKPCIDDFKFGPPLTDAVSNIRFNEIPRGQSCVGIRKCGIRDDPEMPITKNYYQFCDLSIQLQLSVVFDLLEMTMTLPVFNELRKSIKPFTRKHRIEKDSGAVFGYTIEEKSSNSGSETAGYADRTIENIRRSIDDLSKKLTDAEWLYVIKTAGKIMLKPYDSIEEEALARWNEINNGDYVFDRNIKKFRALSKMSANDVRKFVSILMTDGPEMRKLSFQIGQRHSKLRSERAKNGPSKLKGEGQERDWFIPNIEDYKRGLNLLPITVNNEAR